MSDFVAVEWERAYLALGSAEQLTQRDPESAASRAYYAAFHALSALFAARGWSFKKHTAIRAALHRELVHKDLIPKATAEDFDYLLDLRGTGDYGSLGRVSQEDARMAIEKAKRFVAAMAGRAAEEKQ